MSSIKNACQKIVNKYMKIKKNEKLLIVIDQNYISLGRLLWDCAANKCIETSLIMMKERAVDGQEPPKAISNAMLASNVIIIATKKSLTHAKPTVLAAKKGARIASMPSITNQTINRTFKADPLEMEKKGEKIKQILRKSSKVRITTKKGTDITMNIKNRKVEVQAGLITKKGVIDNLPGGEVSLSPIEGKSEGIFVVDASMAGIGKIKNPITIEVKKGMAVKIYGKKEAIKLNNILKSVKNKQAFNIAELGIGINKYANITGNVLEDEKVYGTAHIALGNNSAYGGKVNVPIHLDGVFKEPTIYAENKKIIDNGRLLL